jgi:type IV pilus assembly protein PilM
MPRRVLCLDWDRRYIRTVVAKVRGGGIALEDAYSDRIPNEVDINDPASMGPFIAGVLKSRKIHLRRVVIDMSREKAVINRVSLPPTPTDELAAAIQFQAMRELPFPVEQAVVDFAPTERNENGLVTEVLLTAVKKESLERLQHTCREAGLVPTRIGLRPYGNVLAIRHQRELADLNVLLVDVGPAMTEIDVIKHGTLAFSRAANVDVPIRAADWSEETAADSYEVEGVDIPDFEEARDRAAQDLQVELTRTLQAFRAMEPGTTIDQIVVAGGTGIERGLVQGIATKFDIPVSIYDPSESLGIAADEGAKLGPFSSTLGLAWGLSRDGLLEIDFLDPKRPVVKSEQVRKKVKRLAVLGGVAAALVIGLVAYDMYQLSVENERLEQQLKTARLVELDSDFLETQVERVETWQRTDPLWLEDFRLITESLVEPDPETGVEPKPGERIIVEGLQFDADGSIELDLRAKAVDDLERLETSLNTLERNGKRLYQVQEYNFDFESERGFNVKSTFEIVVIPLVALREDISDDEKERRRVVRRREDALESAAKRGS